jgi:hypothetical protein
MLETALRYFLNYPIRAIRAGIRVGPESFGAWNDGDAAFMRAIWCLIRHLKPGNVIETGSLTASRPVFILEALEKNGPGHLWSIDLPPAQSRTTTPSRRGGWRSFS